MIDIFISYSHTDTVITRRIAELLSASFNRVWYDRYLLGGSLWWHVVRREIEHADCVVFLLSRESFESSYCKQEVYHARANGKPLIPVLVRRFPQQSQISEYHYIDMSEGVDADSLNMLYAALLHHAVNASSSDYQSYPASTRSQDRVIGVPPASFDVQKPQLIPQQDNSAEDELPAFFRRPASWNDEFWLVMDEIVAHGSTILERMTAEQLDLVQHQHAALVSTLYELREKYHNLLHTLDQASSTGQAYR